ncbi:MAG: hypothetical protein ACREC4_03270 [Methylocella sp.]
MNDSPGEAVPGPAAARPRGANVPAAGARGRDSQQGAAAGLVPFKEAEAGSARRPPPRFEQLSNYGSHAALAACLFGFAWAAGSYFSGGQSPFYAIKPPPAPAVVPQESVERTDVLRSAQKMAEDIQTLKANVEALRAAQSKAAKDTSALDGLKTHLDVVKTETGAAIAELAGKVDHMQHESAMKLSQVLERLDRMERQIATPLATASIGAAPAPGKAVAGKQAQLADAQGHPQLMTNWFVRDVYNGIALVESPRGSIEVAPGEIIPGAGRVKSIERRGAGWIVITSRGLIDSARGSFRP